MVAKGSVGGTREVGGATEDLGRVPGVLGMLCTLTVLPASWS